MPHYPQDVTECKAGGDVHIDSHAPFEPLQPTTAPSSVFQEAALVSAISQSVEREWGRVTVTIFLMRCDPKALLIPHWLKQGHTAAPSCREGLEMQSSLDGGGIACTQSNLEKEKKGGVSPSFGLALDPPKWQVSSPSHPMPPAQWNSMNVCHGIGEATPSSVFYLRSEESQAEISLMGGIIKFLKQRNIHLNTGSFP